MTNLELHDLVSESLKLQSLADVKLGLFLAAVLIPQF